VNFTSAVSGYPLCCPFRASLLTSRYPHKCVPGHGYPLPADQPTIAHVFKEHGYKTAYFGKWHLDGARGAEACVTHFVPPERRGGFDEWIGYENNNSQWNTWVHGGKGTDAFQYRLPGYETDELTSLMVKYIKDRKEDGGSPFFAVLSVQPPHPPYAAPAEFRGRRHPASISLRPNVPHVPAIREQARQSLAAYYGMIENLDMCLGRILDALNETGQLLNTHVLFFSDHGDMHGSHGLNGKVVPYEESIRIPFIIGGELQRFFGRKCGTVNAPINHVDIAPTTLGLCGIQPPEWMEGYDYSRYRLDPTPGGPISAPNPPEPDSAFLQAIIPREGVDKAWRGIVTRDGWKYVCFEGVDWLMYNLNEDPYEQVNLAHQPRMARKRGELRDRLRQWILDTDDRFRVPTDESHKSGGGQ